MAIMRRGREEELVLELRRDLHDLPRELGGDRVGSRRRRRGVVGLVEDQERTGSDQIAAQPVAEVRRVFLILDQVVGDDEPVVGPPGIDIVASLLTNPVDVSSVDDLKEQAEPGLHLFPPLQKHGGRTADDDVGHLAAEQELARDEPCLDGLAEPHAIRHEQVDPRHAERHAERFELVMLDA